MRRNQPVTPQRRSEPRQQVPGGDGQPQGGFSAFTPAEERSGARGGGPTPTQVLNGGPNKGPNKTSPPEDSQTSDKRDSPTSKYELLSPINWRVPTRLVSILLIPVVIGLVFGGLRVNTSFDDYTKADRAARSAELARAATQLADDLENERDLSAIRIIYNVEPDKVKELRDKTDADLKAYNAAFGRISDDPTLSHRNDAFQVAAASLPHLRDNAYKGELLASATQNAYTVLTEPLLSIDNSVGLGTSQVTSEGRAIYAMSLAKLSVSIQRVLMFNLMAGLDPNGRPITPYEAQELIQTLLVQNRLGLVALNEFTTGSSSGDQRDYADAQVAQATADQHAPLKMPTGGLPNIDTELGIALQYLGAVTPTADRKTVKKAVDAATAAGLDRDRWLQAANSRIAPLRATELQMLDQTVADAQVIKSAAQTDAILNSAIVIASLALAGLLTGFIARSMILGMRTLNSAALEIANHRLPDLVEKLSKTDPDRVDTSVAPIPLWGKDEIGEVARAFDQVHAQAVSLAAEQALLRGNLNAIFSNLSRRSQSLIQRQLALITSLENNEADPDQLENLFKLDHLATRMRRNGENLLVLAGEEPGRRWTNPVPLVDVLRAASSEVEQYERIELSGIPEAEVVGPAVTDLVHLLAELLENATTFSSPQTRVLVNATRLPDGRVLIEIHDKGIGLTSEDFAEINEKLAEPPTVDATISRRMGLFVVGRLSQRHDIRVQLRPSGESAGTTSLVMLPQQLTKARNAPEPEEQFTVSRVFADQEPTAQWSRDSRQRSAAELGFDDHMTGQAGRSGFSSPALDSVERSQRLDQRRRTAIEPGPNSFEPAGFATGPAEPVEAELVESGYEEQPYAPQGYQEAPYGRDDFQRETFRSTPAEDSYSRNQFGQSDSYGRQEQQFGRSGFGNDRNDQFGQDSYGQEQFGGNGYGQQGYDGYQDNRFGQDYQQDYLGDRRGEQAAGHPYGQEERPALPPAQPTAGPGAGLPQRRPGQQLSGGGLSAQRGAQGGETPNWFTGAKDTSYASEPDSRSHVVSGLGSSGPTGPTSSPSGWQSPNDSSWQRAEQLREPSSSGVTPSGLPRRVPKQNLVPGNAKPGPQDGPQVSRNPEEVRGRLTNLRRGVTQGRQAGGDPGATGSFRTGPNFGRSNGQQNTSTDLFGGSNHQER